jgi:hypothetical protein
MDTDGDESQPQARTIRISPGGTGHRPVAAGDPPGAPRARRTIRRFDWEQCSAASFFRSAQRGWLHPAAKVRGNRVRALLREKPLLNPAERQAWQPTPEPIDPDPAPVVAAESKACSAPRCPRCQQPMRLVGTWRAGQMLPHLNRPP